MFFTYLHHHVLHVSLDKAQPTLTKKVRRRLDRSIHTYINVFEITAARKPSIDDVHLQQAIHVSGVRPFLDTSEKQTKCHHQMHALVHTKKKKKCSKIKN